MNQSTQVSTNYIVKSNGLVVFISTIKENYEKFKSLYKDTLSNMEFLELTDEEYDNLYPKEEGV